MKTNVADALTMLALSVVFAVVSWPPPLFPDDVPNCVSARWDCRFFAVGCLSNHRLSSLFITTQHLEPGRAVWDERVDGNMCGFHVPPSSHPMREPSGFNLLVGTSGVAWSCPYAMFIAYWGALAVILVRRQGLTVFDLLVTTAATALAFSLIALRCALPGVVALNLISFVAMPWSLYSLARRAGRAAGPSE
ncbi:hypothetical protein Mal64_39030 [Pseudobythopirellula maris]|uniref:Uncharacterized protein n=2 Tax=Pseudobythopirellula maris TaxID=2527991 RepID=A0A5C5ZHY7_9BACT|nr:hypothetical protein Mal64_39030 [Pseudobythopirellula maris]